MPTNAAKVTRKGKPLGLYFDEVIVDKMRVVAWRSMDNLTGAITTAMKEAIAKDEKKHGAITEEQIKKIKAKK